MADMTPPPTPPTDVAPDVVADGQVVEPKKPFYATSTGKLVIGVVVACILLGVLAFVVAAFFGASLMGSGSTVGVVVNTTGKPSASAPATASAPITEPQQRPLSSTFTFRNIFAPTVNPPKPVSTAPPSGTSGSTTTSVTVPANTLYLQSIQTVNGQKTATLIWNGTTYNAVAGDTLGDTPWKVLEVDSDSVLMLYGDTQVTLTTGEILTK